MNRDVAKIIVFDAAGNILKLHRSHTHPIYPHEIDLPGGVVDRGETPAEGAVRELMEETGISLAVDELELGRRERAGWGAVQHLYTATVQSEEPAVTISWEHEIAEWTAVETVLNQCNEAVDEYMNLAAEYLEELAAEDDSFSLVLATD